MFGLLCLTDRVCHSWFVIKSLFSLVKSMEAMGESYRASLESNNAGLYEPIWFHAWKVNHGSHFLNKTNYGAV